MSSDSQMVSQGNICCGWSNQSKQDSGFVPQHINSTFANMNDAFVYYR